MKPNDLQAAAEAGARAAAALLPPRPTDRGAVQAFGARMTSYLRRRKSRRAATPAPEPTSPLTKMLLEYEARLNAFCPTGEGGGVDPTCSPRGRTGSGETVVVFHGTAESALASIAEHGLVPKAGKGGDHHALIGGQNYAVTYADVAGRDVSVFVSTDAAKASVFAAKAASVNKSQPVILRLEIPRHLLKEDEAGGSASFHRFEGTIKPEHIKEVLGIDYDRDDFVSRGPLRRPVGNAAAAFLIFFTDGPALNAFCPTGKGGGVDPSCGKGKGKGKGKGIAGLEFASTEELARVKSLVKKKIRNAPVPTPEQVDKARAELQAAARGEGRAGGESRGGSAESRRNQRRNLFKEFGGEDRGYVVCHGTGLKMHWTDDPVENPKGYPKFERGKIFIKFQGGGYQLPNLLPESFAHNRSRNDKTLRPENMD